MTTLSNGPPGIRKRGPILSGMTPADLLRRALAEDPARPFVTYYDDATGERVELSVATFDNWVAKTANLIQEGLLLEPGARVALALPTHWQAQVWLMACWSAGVVAVPGGDPAGCDAVVTDAAGVETARACPGERVVLSLHPLGLPSPEPVPGFVEYATEVRQYGDRFIPYAPVDPDAPALEVAGRVRSGAELVEQAEHTANQDGWDAGTRVLTTLDLSGWEGILGGLLVPLAAGASVVLCRNLNLGKLPERRAAERVTKITLAT